MEISRKDWNNYINNLAKVNSKAAALMRKWAEENGMDSAYELISRAHSLITKYGEAATELSCGMYDSIALAQKARVPPASPAPVATEKEVAKAMLGSGMDSPEQVGDIVGRLVKQAGADTMLQNAKRDGAYFAWISSGDACAFCRTLASQGWQKASKNTIKGSHAEHIHNHCRCEFAIDFTGRMKIEGYDPDKLREQYDAAEGTKWKDKVNSMRREHYAQNKDAINEQKRKAYARNRERSLKKQLPYIYNGREEFIPKGAMIEYAKTIAGKGSKTGLRTADELAARYGGNASDWQKRVGKVTSDKYIFDIHWYEYNGVVYEEKIKFMKER